MARLLTSRLILAPLAGSIVSLSLVALYQQSSTSSTRHLSHAAARADEALDEVKGNRWNQSRPRYESIGEQLKSRWNHHLVSLSESINAVRWDEVVDRLISRTSQLTQNATSAVGNAASSASNSGSSSGSDLANKAEHLSLRTAEDVKAKIEQAAHAVQGGPSASLR
ncbi:hypothetical protein BDZ90DRAFT_54812 [Jaminaea rosea]|uniref:Found in mitochondrial proteome protein 51 n=1 Tax=Jaminaea rosea TaxID=1569628 RepID=A0A316UKY1_9BASI|nr:hypothetical protein BDZ90DRAFT_54812 [Jaminaea rosea]PWN25962.1 hypothetical protein BDZ90DRAFT_54812 [Jaminaea rosea]